MKITKENVATLSAGLGAIAGMRTTIAPAVASHFLSKHPRKNLKHSGLGFMQSSATAMVTKLLTAVELVGDKLPATPNRIVLSQTLPRVLSGALVGAALFQATKQSVTTGLLIGGASALASTFAAFYLRKGLSSIPYLKDPVVGLLEDAVAIKSGQL